MRISQWLRTDQLSIFLFHGVIAAHQAEVRNYNRKHIDAKRFQELLTDLSIHGNPISFDEIIAHHQEQRPFPPNAFSISFDDGFENNLSVAAPLLEKFEIPAIFYITTDFVDNNRMSWIDQIEYAFEKTSAIRLNLPWEPQTQQATDISTKVALLNQIRHHVKRSPDIDIDEFVKMIFIQLEQNYVTSSQDPLDLKLSWEQVYQMHLHPLFKIGGHSHSHRFLSFLGAEELKWEIETSLQLLQQAQVHTQHYSYPEGLAHCYSKEVISCLQENGIVCSPTAIEGHNKLDSSLFELKRINVI